MAMQGSGFTQGSTYPTAAYPNGLVQVQQQPCVLDEIEKAEQAIVNEIDSALSRAYAIRGRLLGPQPSSAAPPGNVGDTPQGFGPQQRAILTTILSRLGELNDVLATSAAALGA